MVRRALMLAAALAAVLAATSAGCSVKDNPTEGRDLAVGDAVPDGFVPAGPSLLVFFNPGCPDCTEEMPVVQAVYGKYGDGLYVHAYGRDLTDAEAKAYAQKEGLTFGVEGDPERAAYGQFARMTIPRCYLCSGGVIRAVWTDDPVMSVESFENEYFEIIER